MFKGQEDADKKAFDKSGLTELFEWGMIYVQRSSWCELEGVLQIIIKEDGEFTGEAKMWLKNLIFTYKPLKAGIALLKNGVKRKSVPKNTNSHLISHKIAEKTLLKTE